MIRIEIALGFDEVTRLTAYRLPLSGGLVPDPVRRMALEARLSRLPVLRHLAAVLAIEARRGPGPLA